MPFAAKTGRGFVSISIRTIATPRVVASGPFPGPIAPILLDATRPHLVDAKKRWENPQNFGEVRFLTVS